eukprot:5280839-Pyramimonas_sp.AAC.1
MERAARSTERGNSEADGASSGPKGVDSGSEGQIRATCRWGCWTRVELRARAQSKLAMREYSG